jgi:hypothetical protein
MTRNQNAGAAQTVDTSSLQDDRQFAERLRIAKRIVQVFREFGYSCELADDGHAKAATSHEIVKDGYRHGSVA